MEATSSGETRKLEPAGQLMVRLVECRLAMATPEEKARYYRSSGQLGSMLSAVGGLGKSHYREDMKQALVDPDHTCHSLAVNLAESGIAEDGCEVFGWISS